MPLPRLTGRRGARVGVATVTVLLAGLTAAPAFAAEGSIDHVESKDGKLQVLYSLSNLGDATPDLKTLSVTLDGKPVDATATLASDAKQAVRRTAILAIDVSDSMAANGKFTEAKRAAQIFLDSAPADLYVGVVTFAGKVAVVQEPSLDRGATTAVVQGLTLSRGTQLYDGVLEAVSASGADGQRSVIVLSDGRDTGTTPLDNVTAAVRDADVKVDVVALAQSSGDEKLLEPLSSAGDGAVISANDPKALGRVFADEAQTLAKQIQITATPASNSTKEGTLAVTVDAGGQTYSDAAFVSVSGEVAPTEAAAPSTHLSPVPSGFLMGATFMKAGLLALGLGVLAILVVLFGGIGGKPATLESQIAPYTRRGVGKRAVANTPQGVTAQAVDLAAKALKSNRGFEVTLGNKLEAGGLSLKPAEWLLLHAAIAVVAGALAFLLSGADPLMTGVALVAGLLLPWIYLGRKQSKRLKAFNAQLAGTLQLMAGSLQAGLSLAQGMDTIVREGQEPVAGEFRRALVETRLGVTIEDALDSVGERMMSDDFKWTVMAIRIQREVGGNLAELMLNVAATLRERDYLRRQVKSLSAEGRFSAYILLALPPGILLYESVANRAYLTPLITTPMGYVLLGAMGGLMGLGAFMMNRMVKLEV